MENRIFYILLLSGLSTGVPRHYHFVPDLMSWADARSHCRQTFTDLATVNGTEELQALAAVVGGGVASVWIGLFDDVVHGWKWSGAEEATTTTPEEAAPFRPWRSGQPGNVPDQLCVVIGDDGAWWDDYCSVAYPFFCSDDYNSLVNVSEPKTWSEAQSYCRQHHRDLAKVTNQAENTWIQNRVVSGSWAWIGLYRDSWMWSDGSNASFLAWGSGQPSGAKYCARSIRPAGTWSNSDCGVQLSSVCYSVVPVKKQVVRLTLTPKEGGVNLRDNAVMAAVLQQIEQKLRENVAPEEVRLTWRVWANGTLP